MEPSSYDVIAFGPYNPLQCTIQHIGTVPTHAHDFFEISMVLGGSATATVEESVYALGPDDILAINAHERHSFRAADAVLVSVQFDQAPFESTLPHGWRPIFFCNSAVQGQSEAYHQLRRLVARVVKNNADQRSGYELRNLAFVYSIMDVFYNNFRVSEVQRDQRQVRYLERVELISRTIKERYNEDLSLSDLAEVTHLSTPYLSKFISKTFGMSFLAYLSKVRLAHAVHDLIETDHTIEEISNSSGFSNSHAFVQAFKAEFGMLPSIYRKRERDRAAERHDGQLLLVQSSYISGLRKYLDEDGAGAGGLGGAGGGALEGVPARAVSSTTATLRVAVDAAAGGRALRHTWRAVLAVGHASTLLHEDQRRLVRAAQQEIGFAAAMFNGIFSDSLHVVYRAPDGSLGFSFSGVDRVLDFVLEVGLTPFIQLSYMPSELAHNPERRLFGQVVSQPRSYAEWEELVRAFTQHIVGRYGAVEVERWRFSVWHQPDAPYFAFSDPRDFYDFYRRTYAAVHEACPGAQVGAPSVFACAGRTGEEWLAPFLSWTAQNRCTPAFLCFNYYDTQIGTDTAGRDAFGFAGYMTLSQEQDGLARFCDAVVGAGGAGAGGTAGGGGAGTGAGAGVAAGAATAPGARPGHRGAGGFAGALPVYLTEWNSSPSQQDLLNDTCFKSCYLVKNLLENYDRLESFAYWALSDLMQEAPTPAEQFFGGIGLFTKDGVPKASYRALCLLARLGDVCVGAGPGWFAARCEEDVRAGEVQVVLYNYHHYSRLYADGERFDMTHADRYTPFDEQGAVEVRLELGGLAAGAYLVRETSVSRTSGSSFDYWVAGGAVEPGYGWDTQELMAGSVPRSHRRRVTVGAEGALALAATLDILEVRLVELFPER